MPNQPFTLWQLAPPIQFYSSPSLGSSSTTCTYWFHGQILMATWEAQHGDNVHHLLSTMLPPDDTAPLIVDSLLAVISSSNAYCFFCHDTSLHTADVCLLLWCAKSDPFAKQIVLWLLQKQPSRPSQTQDPSWSLACIHALEIAPSKTSSDTDPTIPDILSDEVENLNNDHDLDF